MPDTPRTIDYSTLRLAVEYADQHQDETQLHKKIGELLDDYLQVRPEDDPAFERESLRRGWVARP